MTEKTILLLNELTPAQKNYVMNRLAAKEKDLSVAYLCWFSVFTISLLETCKKYTILDYLRRLFHLGYYRFVLNEIPCRRMQ